MISDPEHRAHQVDRGEQVSKSASTNICGRPEKHERTNSVKDKRPLTKGGPVSRARRPLPDNFAGALFLYRQKYRITNKGHIRVPGARAKIVDGRFVAVGYDARPLPASRSGPSTVVCLPETRRMVRVKLAHLAVACFYGPKRIVPGLRVRFRNGNASDLSRDNVLVVGVEVTERVPEATTPTWTERPDLFDQKMWRVLLYALDHRVTTLEQAAATLRVTVSVLLVIVRQARAEQR